MEARGACHRGTEALHRHSHKGQGEAHHRCKERAPQNHWGFYTLHGPRRTEEQSLTTFENSLSKFSTFLNVRQMTSAAQLVTSSTAHVSQGNMSKRRLLPEDMKLASNEQHYFFREFVQMKTCPCLLHCVNIDALKGSQKSKTCPRLSQHFCAKIFTRICNNQNRPLSFHYASIAELF